MYDNSNTVKKSFDLSYLTPCLQQAQWAELIELKKIVSSLARQQQRPISIFDIGVGNARVPINLSGVNEIWDAIVQYDGTDNAPACITIATANIQQLNIADKVAVYLLEAANINSWQKKYDLVICTWFTPGNFYPDNFSFEKYATATDRLDLSNNEKFTAIFKNAYDLLKPGGKLVLGACYLANDNTRLKQEAAYKKMGMHIITSPEDSFTATREGFWSQRFTPQQLLHYLNFVAADKISFIPLDTYDYAMQVVIDK